MLKIKDKLKIPKPSPAEVLKYLKEWSRLDDYVYGDRSLEMLFKKYPLNNNLHEILIKVCALDALYGAGVRFSGYLNVARHIKNLKIDSDLKENDLKFVNKIALIKTGNKKRNLYSFATKYCSFHKLTIYPIYDYYVEKVLIHFGKIDKFDNFSREDLRDYFKYRDIILKFISFYNLNNFNLKQIDQYLFLLGKKYFQKNYKKK